MEFYAIRHKPSGMLMPLVHRGSTHLHLPWGLHSPPRLFTKERSAVVALSWWLKGVVSPSYRTDWESGYTETNGLDIEPRADRKADDMEVVAITLTTKEN